MSRPIFADFKRKALADSKVSEEYEQMELAYELRKKLIALRKEAGLHRKS